jgi:hypothetical protein
MRPGSFGAGVAAWAGAVLSSLCCLLPLAIIVLGLGSGAFMAVTMQYRWILIPAGILGVGTGFVLYARERGRCKQLACRMAGERVTLTLLIVAALVVASSIVLDQFPGVTSELLAKLTKGPESADHSQCQAHAPGRRGRRMGIGDRRHHYEDPAEGVAIVLVEQNVKIALEITRRAYLIQKGSIRWEGPLPTWPATTTRAGATSASEGFPRRPSRGHPNPANFTNRVNEAMGTELEH